MRLYTNTYVHIDAERRGKNLEGGIEAVTVAKDLEGVTHLPFVHFLLAL